MDSTNFDPDLDFSIPSSADVIHDDLIDPSSSDEDTITPPSSPVLGYSRARDPVISAAADSESELLLFCFNCKGTPRPWSSTSGSSKDHSFAADGLILRRQLISTLELLTTGHPGQQSQLSQDHSSVDVEHVDSSSLSFNKSSSWTHGRFFHQTLDPLDPIQGRLLLSLATKNIHILQILSDPKSSSVWGDLVEIMEVENTEADDDHGHTHTHHHNPGCPAQAPWELRKQVVHYFNVLQTRGGVLQRSLWPCMDELHTFFSAFQDAFTGPHGGPRGWPSYLKAFTGNRNGNECSSPLYHLFHVMLELRWTLLVIYRMNSEALGGILEDLVYLAWNMFQNSGTSSSAYLSRQPFNCWCVKELWTMIRLLCEELSINFWSALSESLKQGWITESGDGSSRINNQNDPEHLERSIFFPLWLTSHLASLGDYGLNGVWTPGRQKSEVSKFNGYSLIINPLIKRWISGGGSSHSSTKSCEVYQLLFQLTQFWGFDLEIVFLLWNNWWPKLDKILDAGGGAGSLDNYSSVEKWFKLVQSLAPSSNQQTPRRQSWPSSELDNFIGRDPFLSFLKLLLGHAILAQEQGTGTSTSTSRDWKRLKSHLGMNLNKNSVGNWGEIGLVRVSTMYLSLAWATPESSSILDRLKEILGYGKQSPARVKTVLRASSTGIFILLQKSLDISNSSLTSHLMSTITNLLSQSPLDSGKKDNVMIYLELLESLPKTPGFSSEESPTLGRETLISPNLTMWLSSCGPNYVVRTLRVLYSLTDWIITSKMGDSSSSKKSKERETIASKIFERTTQFLRGVVILNSNRVPNTDVEPMANLAADLTLFSKWNQNHASSTGGQDNSVSRLFDHFALNERTCPEVSQYYVGRLLSHQNQQQCFSSSSRNSSMIPFVKWCQAWIRLNAVDASIPEALTELVLGPGFSSTSNSSLLERLCSTTASEWSRMDIHNTLSPLPTLLKGVMSVSGGGGGLFKENSPGAAKIVGGIIRASSQILRELDWDKIYAKSDATCVGVLLISNLIPPLVGVPPWERLPAHVLSALKPNLFHIFKTITSSPGFDSDLFLQRKTQDLINFAVLGYVDSTNPTIHNNHHQDLLLDTDSEDEACPAAKIMIYSEDHAITHVLSVCIPHLAGMMVKQDLKLNGRFVSAITGLKNNRLTTTVRRFLGGILSIYVNGSSSSELSNPCLSIILYCCTFGLTPQHRDAILATFDACMESSFAFKSKRFWELASALGRSSRVQVKKFLKNELLPLFKAHVTASEQRRGTGTDMSLRNPLEKLEREVAGF